MNKYIDRLKEVKQNLDLKLRIAEFTQSSSVMIDKMDAYFYMALLDELILRLEKENQNGRRLI